MSGSKRSHKSIILLLTCIIIICTAALCLMWLSYAAGQNEPSGSDVSVDTGDDTPAKETKPAVVPSHSPGYYTSAIELELFGPDDYDILYTVTLAEYRSSLDGRHAPTGEAYFYYGGIDPLPETLAVEEPESLDVNYFNSTAGKLHTHLFGKALDLCNPGYLNPLVIGIKAALYDEGRQVSDVQYFTYILGSSDGDKSFEDIFGSMVIAITIDEDYLYNYETGIYIFGKAYDDALAAGIQIDPWTPRNYNRRGKDWERRAHVDFYETDGTIVLSAVCGVRIAGGTSRGAGVKSLKLVADDIYGGEAVFNYAFFENARDCDGEQITSFSKLVLRNIMNDIGGTGLRDQLVNKLGGEVGVDYQEGRNAVVYLNGKYYALMCLHESLDGDYQENHYHLNSDNIASFLIKSDQYRFAYKQESGTPEQYEIFIEDMNYLIYNDFSHKDLKLISDVIDVENFCRYMAYQIYIYNADWPHNNVLIWRYFGPENDSVEGMDGRWRFVLKDLDFGLNSPDTNSFRLCLDDLLASGEPCIGTVLRNLLKNPEFRSIFRQCCIDVTEKFSPEFLKNYIQKEVGLISMDMKVFSRYCGKSYEAWYSYFDEWYYFADKRNEYFLKYLDMYAPAA